MKLSKYLIPAAACFVLAACSATSATDYGYKDFTYYQHHLDEAKSKAASCKAQMDSAIGTPQSAKSQAQYILKKDRYLANFRTTPQWPECNAASLVVEAFAPKDALKDGLKPDPQNK